MDTGTRPVLKKRRDIRRRQLRKGRETSPACQRKPGRSICGLCAGLVGSVLLACACADSVTGLSVFATQSASTACGVLPTWEARYPACSSACVCMCSLVLATHPFCFAFQAFLPCPITRMAGWPPSPSPSHSLNARFAGGPVTGPNSMPIERPLSSMRWR